MLADSILILGLAALPAMAGKLFGIPPGAASRVSIIDSTLRISHAPASFFLTPKLEGFDDLPTVPAWSFLIQSSTGKKAVFDLSVPPDPYNSYPPSVVRQLEELGWGVQVDKHVSQVLEDGGVNLTGISSIIWSHHHFDHTGDPSTFPATTELVVGPGFKDALLPAYPTNPDSALHERYFANRTLREIDFSAQSPPLFAGGFRAFDFFGDGSFYLLDTPGHAVGHLGGLARTTTNPDTFIFMGGDLCHHSAQLRPSPDLRIPSRVHLHLDEHEPFAKLRSHRATCPGASFEQLNIKRGRKRNEPFFDPVLVVDLPLAMDTIKKAQKADAAENVLFVFAHDPYIADVADLFPKTANQWKKKGWAERVRWRFLKEFLPALEVANLEGGKV